jgi:hypothetical protein
MTVGPYDGSEDGPSEPSSLNTVGTLEGCVDGAPDGIVEGASDGIVEGASDGTRDGESDPRGSQILGS